MDVAARDRLAELMYEVKDKVPDGTFLEFMNILGKKENKPDFKDVYNSWNWLIFTTSILNLLGSLMTASV